MKKILSLMLITILSISALTGCGSSQGKIETTIKDFPEFGMVDFEGNEVDNSIFEDYAVTVVNFWYTGCMPCVEELPDLEADYQKLKEQGVNFIGVCKDAGNQELKEQATKIMQSKGITYKNYIPVTGSSFETDFITDLVAFPTTYLVNREGKIIGAPIVGVLSGQQEQFEKRIEQILEADKK